MRFLIKIEMPVERGNVLAKEGTLLKRVQSILEDQKPEAAQQSRKASRSNRRTRS